VLDDSTDETRQIAELAVRRFAAQGVDITHRHRTDRAGFKAGALAAGLRVARGAFIAIFDADFIPSPDFLLRLMPHFSEPRVGMVQARWGHSNRDYSLLTRIQAILLDRIEADSDEWLSKRYRQAVAVQPLVELALGLYFTWTVFYALANQIYGTVPFLVLFQIGFLYTGLLSIVQQYAGEPVVLKTQVAEGK
jgi:glycosyltransferase involved in cell wall biosynthesis